MTSVKQIGIKLTLDGKEFTSSVQLANARMREFADQMEGGMDRGGRAAQALSNHLARMGHVAAAALGASKLLGMADAVTTLNNTLRLSTGSAAAAGQAYDALFQIAQRSRVSFSELGNTFASLNRAGKEMGVSQQRILTVTEAVGNAMAMSGGSAQSMQAALVQLGQGMASGVLRGEELNSVMEQAPRLARALADGMGIPLGKLRELGQAGQITAEQVVRALESQAAVLRGEVSGATLTAGQAFTQLGNATMVAVGELDKATGASAAVARAISGTAEAITLAGKAFKEHETVISTTLGVLGGAATAAGVARVAAVIGGTGGMVGAIAAVRTAFLGLTAAMAANPAGLALLGIGAVVGGAVAYGRAEARTADGIQRSIDSLRAENERSEAALKRAMDGGRAAGADTIRKTIDDRKKAIAELNAELALMGSKGLDTRVEDERLARHTEAMKKAASDAQALDKLRMSLSGVPDEYPKQMQEVIRLNQAGVLVGKEYTDTLAQMQAQLLKKTEHDKGGVRSQEALNNSFQSFIGQVRQKTEAQQAELATGQRLSQADGERARLQTALATSLKGLSAGRRAEIEAAIASLDVAEKENGARKDQIKVQADLAAAREQSIAGQQRELEASVAGNERLRDEIATLGMTRAELARYTRAQNDATLAKLEDKAATMALFDPQSRELELLRQQIEVLRERSELLGRKADRELDIEGAKAIEKTEKATEQMGQALVDNLMRGGKSAKQYLIDLFRTTVLRPILAPVGTAMAGLFGGTGAALAGQSGGAGSALGLMGNAASSLFSGLTGNWLGAGTMGAMFANIGAGFTTGLTTLLTDGIGAAFSQAAGLISAGSTGGGIGALAGAAALPALGLGLLGNALGLFRSLERRGGGLIGTLGQSGGVHDVDLMRRGGTLFSGPDWFTEDKGVSALDRVIQAQFAASKEAIKGFAETLGLATGKVDGFTTALGTQTMGDHGQIGIRLDKDGKPLSDQEVQAEIAAAIKAGSNELAQQLIGTWSESVERVTRTVVQTTGGTGDGWTTSEVTEDRTTRTYKPSEFAREGEQAIDTLTRLATSLQGANGLLDTLGLTTYEASLKGGDLASKLADAAGGMDKLQANGAAYFQAFYTGSEQHATALRQVREQFEALGMTMPANRAGLRAMVEGIDRTTEAGQKLFAQLLALAPQLAAVMPQLFQAGGDLASILTQGMLGTFEGENIGAAMAQTVSNGIYSAIAGYFAQQVTDILVAGVIDPVIQAAITGASVSGAVSAASIAASVEAANAAMATMVAVINDPAFQDMLSQITSGIGQLKVPTVRASASVQTYTSAVSASGSAADSAAKAAADLAGSWRTLLGEVKGVFDVVHQAVRELRGDDANVMMRAAQGRAFIDDALAAMRATGALPDADKLREAIDAARGGLRQEDFASVADYQRQQLILAGQLGEMEDVAGKQMSYAEQQVKLLEAQKDTGQAQLDVLRAQLRLAGGSVPEPAPSTPAPLPWLGPRVQWPQWLQSPAAPASTNGGEQRELLARLDDLIRAVRTGAASSDEVHRLLQRVTRNGQAMQTETTP